MKVFICLGADGEGGEEVRAVFVDMESAATYPGTRFEECEIAALPEDHKAAIALLIALNAARHFQHCPSCGEGPLCSDGDDYDGQLTEIEESIGESINKAS